MTTRFDTVSLDGGAVPADAKQQYEALLAAGPQAEAWVTPEQIPVDAL